MKIIQGLLVSILSINCFSENFLEMHIKNLGITNFDFQEIEKFPEQALSILVKELHPIKIEKILQMEQSHFQKEMHVIWCLRTLRYLTGTNFLSSRTDVLGNMNEDQAYWLGLYQEDGVPFFSVWMSRDTIFISPENVQLEIIEKWKTYLRQNKYFNDKKIQKKIAIDDWYF